MILQNTLRMFLRVGALPFVALAALPAAQAQNECGVQMGPLVECDPAAVYPDGITYDATGDLTLELSGPGTATLNLGPGVRVQAAGDDAIAWDSTAFTRSLSGNGAAVIDYQSENGDIDIQANGFSGTATNGIRAVSNDGDIRIRLGQQQTGSFISRGISADTRGGSGNIEVDLHNAVSAANGISLRTGTGTLRLDVHSTGALRSAGTTPGLIVDAGGDALITLHPGSTIAGSTNSTVTAEISLTAASGTTTVLDSRSVLNRGASFDFSSGAVAVRGAGQGEFIIHNRGGMRANVDFSAMTDTSAPGAPSNAGRVTYHNYARDQNNPTAEAWVFTDNVSRFSAGDDLLDNHVNALIASSTTGSFNEFSEIQTEVVRNGIDFGAGDDLFRNQGVFLVGEAIFTLSQEGGYASVASDPRAFETTLSNLETFENTGTIVLGGYVRRAPKISPLTNDMLCGFTDGFLQPYTAPCLEQFGDTDSQHGSTLAMPGTRFVGGSGSTLILDARFGLGVPQADCYQGRATPQQRLRLPGADCVDLRGGSTEGVTQVIVRDRVAGDAGAGNPEGIVIVDVSNGSSGAGHFVLSPESDGYDAETGAIDKGMVMYPLLYDADQQQHKLVGLAGPRAFRGALLLQGAQEVTRTAGNRWFSGDPAPGRGDVGGVWAEITGGTASRDADQSVSAYGTTIGFRNDYDQDSTVLSIGRDFRLAGDAGAEWLVGGSIGYANARMSFDASSARAEMDGVILGGHARYARGRFFVDAQLLSSWLRADYTDPYYVDRVLNEVNVIGGSFRSLSGRAETGYRMQLAEAVYVEPLVGLSWVRTEAETVTVKSADSAGGPQSRLYGEDTPASLRAVVGARAGVDQRLGTLRLSLQASARLWEELRGKTRVEVSGVGAPVYAIDDFDARITELSLSANLGDASGRVSGLLEATGQFGDYESFGMTAGFQYRW